MLGNNIRYLRTKRGFSQDYIAEQLGYKSYTTIQKWESGVSEPPIKKLKELSLLLNVDMDDITNKDLQAESNSIAPIINKHSIIINVPGKVAAGIPLEAIEDIVDTEEISGDMANTGTFFGLIIHGDSMEPKISQGDVVIVRRQEDAETGDIVIATINGDDTICKRLKKYKDGIVLLSTNPAYDPIYFSNEEIETKPVKIIGKVVELRAKF